MAGCVVLCKYFVILHKGIFASAWIPGTNPLQITRNDCIYSLKKHLLRVYYVSQQKCKFQGDITSGAHSLPREIDTTMCDTV
jgi:hypothetical protein